MSIKPVSDLYLITYEDGSPYKSTRDAKEAVDAIGAGFKVEEFVSLENHRAAMLQAEPVTTANKLGGSPAQSPIDHGYRKGCECSGCKTTVRICAELAGNTPVNGVTAGKPLTNGDVVTTKSRCTIQTAPALDSSQKNAESRCGNSSAIPDGYVMVPKEPTVNQWAAGMQAFDSGVDKVTRVYKAMLAAAPQEVNSWSSHYLPVTRGDAVGCPFNREEEP